jgi:catalase
VTKVWPHADYPPITIGRLVLDRNPENHSAEVEHAGFAPSNLVPGIGPSPDKMLMGRMFSYHATHTHPIGVNYQQLPINAPKSLVSSYNKDGAMTYRVNGPQPVPTWSVEVAELGGYAYEKHAHDDDFVQARALYQDVMTDNDREHLAMNIGAHASDHVSRDVQNRVVAYWSQVDRDLGLRVAQALDPA